MKSIWWNQVTNAIRFVSDIRQCLLEEKSLLLMYSSAMPWREQFEDCVRESVKLQDANKKFVNIPDVPEPGKYLLEKFCKKEKIAEYRPLKGYAKFFAENDDIVLHDRYLWIRVGSAECLEKWLLFIDDYIKKREKHDNKAVFILEWLKNSKFPIKKGIKVFSFDDYIGEYDRIVFAALAVSNVKEQLFIKNYIVELGSNISGNDIELCAECIQGYKDFLKNPNIYMKKTIEEKRRSDGSEFFYNKNDSDVEHLIWLSQIKTVYPRLEEYREEFVQKHANAIAKQLPIQTSYGEEYTDPKDVELGTLVYIVGSGNLTLDTFEYERLKRYREARNKLSHLTVLSIKEIEELI